MRLLFLALMITLLPLRGWVGDVMAVERIGQAPTAAQHASAPQRDCHETPAHHGPADAASHEETAHATGQGSAHASGDCAGCTVCQICHSVALAGVPSPAPAATLTMALPQTQVRLHASAERAPGFKPPIS